jgi:ABC-type branched-subunit amino acid transport system substrate-binding protein
MTSRTMLRVGATVAVLALAASACGGNDSSGGGNGGANTASAPGITADTVTIGSHQPLTGPAAPGYSEIAPAAKAYFDYVNANGGINGRKIVYKYLDDGYNPTNTVTVTKQLVLQDKVFAIFSGLGTPTHTKVVDFLNSSRVPDLFVSSGCQCWDSPKDHPYTFGYQPDYVVEGKILGQYVKLNFAGKKVAYFTQDDDFGADGIKGLDKYVPGAQVVSRQVYTPGNTDVAPQVSAIAAAKPDVVVLFTIPAYTALFKLTALKLGISPAMVVSNVGADPITLTGLLENFAKQAGATVKGTDLIEGVVTDSYLPTLGDTTNTWIALFKKVHDQYIPKLPFDGNVLFGMSQAYTFAQALQAAGRNPTRQGIVDALEKGGLIGPGLVPFRFSKDSHAGYTGVQIGVIQKGVGVPQGQPQTTDDGDGEITPNTQAPAQAPANGIPAG